MQFFLPADTNKLLYSRLSEAGSKNEEIETSIENLSKETFEAEHYTKELEKVLQDEKDRSLKIQNEVDSIIRDIVLYGQEITELKFKEKLMDNQLKVVALNVLSNLSRILCKNIVHFKPCNFS